MPEAWIRYQQVLVLSAFVAGCSVADLMLQIAQASIDNLPTRPRIRLVSDFHGILVEKDQL